MLKRFLVLAIAVLLAFSVCACKGHDGTADNGSSTDESTLCERAKENILTNYRDKFSGRAKELISKDFLDWIEVSYRSDSIYVLEDELQNGTFSEETWFKITDNTIRVLECYYKGELDPNDPDYRNDIREIGVSDGETIIRIVGDVSLADNWKIAPMIDSRKKGILGVLSEETVELLKTADITLLNNEFTFSKRGEPIPNKYYTFRADPSRVELLHEIGTDIVSLANNHAFDFGEDAFLDTLETLKNAGIQYVGGGKDIAEAVKPQYYIVGGRMVAFTAATRAEKYILTPEADNSSPGVLRTYNPERYMTVIAKAEKECDYNIVYVHWGAEGSHEIEKGLPEMGKGFIDSGADAVIGAHAHVLQGIEFYKGKPIVYNLGNFIFNAKTMDTGIFEISWDDGLDVYLRFIPCVQSGCYTKVVHGSESKRVLDFIESLSINVTIDENGVITEKKEG